MIICHILPCHVCQYLFGTVVWTTLYRVSYGPALHITVDGSHNIGFGRFFSTLLCVSVCLNTPWFWIYWMFYDHLSARLILDKLGRWGWLIRMRLAWKKNPKCSLKTVTMLSKDMDGNAKRESWSYLGADVCYIRVHDGGRSYIGWVW